MSDETPSHTLACINIYCSNRFPQNSVEAFQGLKQQSCLHPVQASQHRKKKKNTSLPLLLIWTYAHCVIQATISMSLCCGLHKLGGAGGEGVLAGDPWDHFNVILTVGRSIFFSVMGPISSSSTPDTERSPLTLKAKFWAMLLSGVVSDNVVLHITRQKMPLEASDMPTTIQTV